MNIDDLLEKYFEGDTSADEERRLRAFFASDGVPPGLEVYRPLFAWFDGEIRRREAGAAVASGRRKRYMMLPAAAAAVALLVAGGLYLLAPGGADPCLCSPGYALIDGRCYTDMQTVRELAREALREVAAPDGVPLPGIGSLTQDD
ncbi:MAG: hypothetical protein LBP25_04440 [Tannerellaceae bacterium]|jgi:hypothetical protein|nr:hypothetical protein [Tannerellaceae bacterium]